MQHHVETKIEKVVQDKIVHIYYINNGAEVSFPLLRIPVSFIYSDINIIRYIFSLLHDNANINLLNKTRRKGRS